MTTDIGPVAGIGSSPDAIWVVATMPALVTKLDPAGKTPPVALPLPAEPCGPVAVDFGAAWVPLCSSKRLARVDIKEGAVTSSTLGSLAEGGGSIVAGVGSLWLLADGRGTLQRIDPAKTTLVAEVYLPAGSRALAFGAKALWAAGGASDTVVKIDPHTNLILTSIKVPGHPAAIAVDGDVVWVLASARREVVRIDAGDARVVTTIVLAPPDGPAIDTASGVIAASDGNVWVSATGAPLVRIDARTNRVAQVFTGDAGSRVLEAAHRSLWMAGPRQTLIRIDPRLVAALR